MGCTLAGIILATLSTTPALAAPAASGAVTSSATTAASSVVLDVVLLVDESGSETAAKVAAEKQTVGTIVQSLLNPASRVTVIGFGGVNNVKPNQSPVDIVCPPTIANSQANLDLLSSCVNKLHKRTEAEGDDTDYAAALNEAMNYLSPDSTATPASPAGAHKVIMMMTDGAVDVHRNTAQYGSNWQLGEQTAINSQMQAAKSDGVELWPLGFGDDVGTDVDQATATQYLDKMASAGAPAICNTRTVANQPHATWVNNLPEAIKVLDELYADAACYGTNTNTNTVSNGLVATIPAIASSAAISVDRVNPSITVTFKEPDGTTWTDGSAVSGADGNSLVEVLHLPTVTQADVGTWHIVLTAPSSLQSQLVSATAFWQGAVRAIITATPSVKPGQPISVTLTVLGPTGPITDSATLKSLQVGVTATGSGLPGVVGIKVKQLSGTDNVGTYSGTLTAPKQPTSLTITGTASGYGLYPTEFPATVQVGQTTSGFVATPQFSGGASVGVGGSVTGNVVFTNDTGSAKQVVLKLTADGTTASVSPATVLNVPAQTPGGGTSIPFKVSIDPSAKAGLASLELQVVDAKSGQLYNTVADEIQVTVPPPWWKSHLWLIILILVLIILVIIALLLARKARRDAKNVRGLVVTLRRGGAQCGRDLVAPGTKYAEVLPFVVREPDSASPLLDYPNRDVTSGTYQLRRAGRGLASLTTPTGIRPYQIELGGGGQQVEHGLEIAVKDTRRPTGRRRGPVTPPVPGVPPGGGYVPSGGYVPDAGYGANGGNTPNQGYVPDNSYSPTGTYPPVSGYPPPPAPTAPATPANDTLSYDPNSGYDPSSGYTVPNNQQPGSYTPPENPWMS